MISLQRFFGKNERFFDLLEASATEVRGSATLLGTLLERLRQPAATRQSLEEFAGHRRKDKTITRQITEELCRTFVTPLEREDIEALAESLYKIPKTVNKISDRLIIFSAAPDGLADDFQRQITLLEQATEVVETMVRTLRGGTAIEKVRDMNERLQSLEGEADKLILKMLQALYQGQREAREVLLLKDISELLEKAIDRCRDAGDTVFQVVLKNS